MQVKKSLAEAAADLFEAVRQRLDEPVSKTGSRGTYTSPTTASGTLKEKLRFEIKTSPGTWSMEIFAPYYWRFADRGRPAGKAPPVQALVEWSEDKGINFQTVQQRRSFAFALARRIAANGTLPEHSEAFQRNLPPWANRLPDRLAPAFAAEVGTRMRMLFDELRQDPTK